MKRCASCGTDDLPSGARFCPSCGSSLEPPACTSCGVELSPGARFCSSCGAPQRDSGSAEAPSAGVVGRPAVSRRVTSVLFGDLVGFTALSESRDQEQVRELLTRYFEDARAVVGRYGGTVEKFIGDAVMAVWGVPTAHEDDAERSVRAGLELVDAVARLGGEVGVPELAMRVGIVTGEVAVSVGAREQGMVAGDAVNTASRVQSVAEPGQVWVDESTRLLASSAITFRDAGSHRLKGKVDPVPLWAVRAVVAAVGGAQRADGLEAPLVGRDRELRLVKEVFHRVVDAGAPALLVIDGEAGVGKTRLAWEFEKYVDGLSTQVWWHQGRCLSYGDGVAFYPLAEAVRARLALLCGAEAGAADEFDDPATLLSAGLDRLVFHDAAERAWIEARLAVLLGSGTGGAGAVAREEKFSAWTMFFERLSVSDEPLLAQPVVLVVDDAQYADDGLLAFLEQLVTEADFPVFVALLTRPGLLEANGWLATNRRSTVVHLDPLSDRDTAALLDGLVAGLDPVVRDGLVERSEGVPLFAVETVRSLIDRDLIVPRGGEYVLAGDGPLDLAAIGAPASLQALVAARLDQLTADERRVVDQASVAGRSTERETLAALCPEVGQLDLVLAALVRAQILRKESNRLSAEHGMYQFVQAVVQQVAYASLSRRDRKAGHLAVATLLTDPGAGELTQAAAGVVAQHYLDAADAVPEDADAPTLTALGVDQLERAADRAMALGSPVEAAGHLRTAMARIDDHTHRARVEVALAEALRFQGDYAEATTHAIAARDAFDALGDDLAAAGAVAIIARARDSSRTDGSAAVAAMAQERFDALRDRPDALRVRLSLAGALFRLQLRESGDLGELAEQNVVLAEQLGDRKEIADSYNGLAIHYSRLGCRHMARHLQVAGADLARLTENRQTLATLLLNIAAEWTCDDIARAIEVGVEAHATSRLAGRRDIVSGSAVNLSTAHLLRGSWADALRWADLSADDPAVFACVTSHVQHPRGLPWTPPADISGPGWQPSVVDHAFVDLAIAAQCRADGRIDEAIDRVIGATRTMFEVSQFGDDFCLAAALATQLIWECGRPDRLGFFLEMVEATAVAVRPVGVLSLFALASARVAMSGPDPDADRVSDLLREAIAHAEAWHSDVVAAHASGDLGAWLVRHDDPEQGRALLDRARTTYEALGARVWLDALDSRPAELHR